MIFSIFISYKKFVLFKCLINEIHGVSDEIEQQQNTFYQKELPLIRKNFQNGISLNYELLLVFFFNGHIFVNLQSK